MSGRRSSPDGVQAGAGRPRNIFRRGRGCGTRSRIMPNAKPWVVAGVALAFSGCVSSSVQKGTLIGALSGAALGAGTGVLITNDKLLGSTPESRLELEKGPTLGASLVVGTVFGAIVGAMIGHGNDHSDRDPAPEPSASAKNVGPTAF